MSVTALKQPIGVEADADLDMGLQLLAEQRRARLVRMTKVGLVWVGLIVALIVFLLYTNVEPAYMAEHYGIVLQGLATTIGISVISILIASILALAGALARLSHNSIAQGISGFYVSLIRGTPLIIQIYIIYLGLPQIGTAITALGYPTIGSLFILDAVPAGILALSLNYGAYMTEIFRAGLQAISHGQSEAAAALGLTRSQTLRRIILPQAVRIIIPDIGNQFIAMQKDSALVSIMGVWEITYLSSKFARRDIKFIEMFLVAAAMYWILTIVSSWLQSWLERRMAHAYER
ncbi:MAG TPA: amino acid ABC transporter permease [Anaerolineae bacterium]|nr:amino acid ABC transporter permease [Anaerolineae bacterium]